MNKRHPVDIAEAFRLGTPIDEAMNEAVRQAVEEHRRLGLPLVVWQDGRVVEIPADEAPILHAEPGPSGSPDPQPPTGDH